MKLDSLKKYIRNIPDFPKQGIIFKDITTLIKDKKAFKHTINFLAKNYAKDTIDVVVAVESRGFIFGGALAYKLGVGFIPVRKKGKLPYKTNSVTYSLEYGTDTLEMHQDAIKPNDRVLILDDLLATGGTTKAVIDLVKQQQGQIVGICFVIELTELKGMERLSGYPVYSLIKF